MIKLHMHLLKQIYRYIYKNNNTHANNKKYFPMREHHDQNKRNTSFIHEKSSQLQKMYTLIQNEIPNDYPKKQKDGPRIAMPRAQLSFFFFSKMVVSSSLSPLNKLKPFFLFLFTRRETKKWPTQLLTYENSPATCFFLSTQSLSKIASFLSPFFSKHSPL